MNKVINLRKRPQGKPNLQDFEIKEISKPSISEGEVLLKSKFISVDPYLRGRMRDEKSYIPPFGIGKPINSMIVSEVAESQHPDYSEGDQVIDMQDWKKWQVSDGESLRKVDSEIAPLSAYLGILGLTGLTAYFGLLQVGEPEKGETVVVSGASGAVGSTVGQLAHNHGCKVVGIAGSDEKIALMKEKFGYDEGVNYKKTEDIFSAIKEYCPDGVDVYFDNVGGEISDQVLQNMNDFGRIAVCGSISLYNDTEIPTGPRIEPLLVKRRLRMQGFLVRDFSDEFMEAIMHLATQLHEGKLTYEETVVEGFENTPQAFIDLFEGRNKGKMVVEV